MNDPQPILLIGAARSGTKLMRQLIASHPAVSAVPYDVNYLWRIGSEAHPHDELPVERLTPDLRSRLRRRIAGAATGRTLHFVEKTVGNCLRVPYVHAVFPEGRFIHLVRNGLDVVESSYRQWTAPTDWSYVLRKTLSYPLLEAFGYGWQYGTGLLSKVFGSRARARHVWGPRYAGIEADLAARPIVEVCAIQWARCMTLATTSLAKLPAGQVLTVRYEELVHAPLDHLLQIADFIGLDPRPYRTADLSQVSPNAIGRGLRRLSAEQQSQIEPHLAAAAWPLPAGRAQLEVGRMPS